VRGSELNPIRVKFPATCGGVVHSLNRDTRIVASSGANSGKLLAVSFGAQ
jgi:hypothetical protein